MNAWLFGCACGLIGGWIWGKYGRDIKEFIEDKCDDIFKRPRKKRNMNRRGSRR